MAYRESARHLTTPELEEGLEGIRTAPADGGTVELIVRRPETDGRETLDVAELDVEVGLVGDIWSIRPSKTTPDGSPDPRAQVTLVNVRAISLLAGTPDRWALAGDQLYVDLDLGEDNLPPGTRLAVGTAVIEVSAKPHTGCAKFSSRFGRDALRFVNSPRRPPAPPPRPQRPGGAVGHRAPRRHRPQTRRFPARTP